MFYQFYNIFLLILELIRNLSISHHFYNVQLDAFLPCKPFHELKMKILPLDCSSIIHLKLISEPLFANQFYPTMGLTILINILKFEIQNMCTVFLYHLKIHKDKGS